MTQAQDVASPRESAWEEAIYAFLVEKGNRSGSRRTVESYGRMLWPFFAGRTPDAIRPADVFGYAHGVGASGRAPSAATIGARITCLSSFYRFLIRMGLVASNPCDALQRPKTVAAPARGHSAEEVRRLLAAIPDTVAGRRDRAIVLTLVLTGRRRAEVLGLQAGDLTVSGATATYTYRGKGGKRGRRELPRPALEAIIGSVRDAGKELAAMAAGESLWQAGTRESGLSTHTFYLRFRRYLAAADLPPSGVHITRHTAAKLRRDAGDAVESVSAFLDHSSLAVTTVYLRRLEGEHDATWERVAEAIGVSGDRLS